MHAFDFLLVLFSFVFVCRDLVASRRRQHIVFGRQRLKLIVRRDEQDREARRVGRPAKEKKGRKGVRSKYFKYRLVLPESDVRLECN